MLGINIDTLQHEVFVSLLNKARTVWNAGQSLITTQDVYEDYDSHIKFHIPEIIINDEAEFWSCVKKLSNIFPDSVNKGYIPQMLGDAKIL